jgi:hypothetical protein
MVTGTASDKTLMWREVVRALQHVVQSQPRMLHLTGLAHVISHQLIRVSTLASLSASGSSEPDSRRACVALPSCHVTLTGRKPLPSTYPRQLRTVGDDIRRRRLDLRLCLRDAARRLGVHCSSESRWERSVTQPTAGRVPSVFEFLGHNHCDSVSRTTLGKESMVLARRSLRSLEKGVGRGTGVGPGLSRGVRTPGTFPQRKATDAPKGERR